MSWQHWILAGVLLAALVVCLCASGVAVSERDSEGFAACVLFAMAAALGSVLLFWGQ